MNGKTLFLGLGVLLVVIVFVLVIVNVMGRIGSTPQKPSASGNNAPFDIPTQPISAPPGTLSIPTPAGAVRTRDFLHDQTTVQDQSGEGFFSLSGPYDGSAPYELAYDQDAALFSVVINRGPVGMYRSQAEQTLMRILGVNESSLCKLRELVVVGPDVSNAYLHQNLGFSFCPGAIPVSP